MHKEIVTDEARWIAGIFTRQRESGGKPTACPRFFATIGTGDPLLDSHTPHR